MRFGARRRRENFSLFDAFSKGETLFLGTQNRKISPKIRDIFDYHQNHQYLPPLVSESKRGKGGVNIDGIALILVI